MPPDKEARIKAFERLILPHIDSAANLARWLSGRRDEAMDLVQEAYLRAYKSFDSFSGENGRAWLFAIVRNTFYTARARQRARGEEQEFDEEIHAPSTSAGFPSCSAPGDPSDLLEQKAERELVQRLLESLPCKYREVLVLREVEGLSYKEIAEIAGIPAGTVMSRLSRARALLQKKLQAHAQAGV